MPNTIANRYYPRLSEVVSLEDLPDFLSFVEGGLQDILDRIHYKNLQYSRSFNGDAASYSLDLVTRERLDFPLPGGMQLVLNPDVDGDAGISSFPIAVEYKWEILAFLKAFRMEEFSWSVQDFFQLGLKVFRLDEVQVTAHIINFFVEPVNESTSRYQQVLNDVNSFGNTNLAFPQGEEETFSLLMQTLRNGNVPDGVTMSLFGIYVLDTDPDTAKRNLNTFYRRIVPEGIESYLKKLITPKVKAGFTLSAGLEFPRNMLKPVYNPDGSNPFNTTNPPDPTKALQVIPEDNEGQPKFMLRFAKAQFNVDTEKGLGYQMDLSLTSNAYAQIADTGFVVYIDTLKLDLSKQNNIEEATLDGRPEDFIGAYIKEASVSFPAKWNHDSVNSTAQLFVENALIGTGGLSGTIGMRANDPQSSVPALIHAQFGQNFHVSLSNFSLTFQQNAIIESNIHGKMQIPGFKNEDGSQAIIAIDIHIGQDGEFSIVAAAEPQIKKIKVPNVFDFDIHSAFIGREKGDNGRFYLGISGELEFKAPGALGNFLPDKLDIKKMLIYDDGTFEFEGGKLVLPKAYTLSFGPATVAITGIHMGAHEQDRRKYKYFGFDGGVSTEPGGVDAQGKGLKFYYTSDGLTPFLWFLRLESLEIDIMLPSGTNPEDAAVIIHGFLSIAEPKITAGTTPEMAEVLKNSQEYAGAVSVRLPKFRGLQGSAAMRMNPKVPSFIIDLGIEMTQPVLLGATGLGIYGFRALLGKNYVAEKTAAGIPADGEWWQYYKAKVDPDFKEGIQVSKFNTRDGFSLGAGVSLATASDAGKAFSSKLFFMLSLPDVFLFQGQAQFLKERISLDANPDPPFFAIIAITKNSIEAGFGVNYKLRDNGKLVTVDGIVEMGFFWGNSSAWYVNIGRETPEDRRIQARLFDILNMYFYLMLSSGNMRLGAGAKYELAKKFGPISAELKAYIDTFGKVSRRPKQIGGAIKMGGKVSIKVCGFGFGVTGGATLAAEASQPHIITGEFEVCVTVLKKERCAKFEFTWNFNNELSLTHNPVLVGTQGDNSDDLDTEDAKRVAGMTHMVTEERYPVAYTSIPYSEGIATIPHPDTWITDVADDFRVPIDSYLDIDFKKGINVNSPGSNNLGKLGGISSPSNYVEFVPPLRAKSDRVRHEYYLRDITIAYWDEVEGKWKPYDFYAAMFPMYDNALLNGANSAVNTALQQMKWGYWQQQTPGLNNKLRILATTPLSYLSKTADALTPEDLGINANTILCPGEKILPTCVIFNPEDVTTIYPAGTLRNYENVLFRTINQHGVVIAETFEGLDQGLSVASGDTLEIYFAEPMFSVNLLFNTTASQVTVEYYSKVPNGTDNSGLPVFAYELMDILMKTSNFDQESSYETSADGIELIKIIPGTCNSGNTVISELVPNAATILTDVESFLETLIANHQLTSTSMELYPAGLEQYENFFGSSIYAHTPGKEDQVMVTQQHISPVSLSFTVTDNLGYNCNYSMEATNLPDGFTFASITGVKGISAYTADDTLGNHNNLLVDFDVVINGNRLTARFILTTCHTISVGYNSCNASLYKLCYLSLENHLLNTSIPDSVDQQTANATMFDSINLNLQPVWRPNTTFAVSLKTADQLYREGSSNAAGGFFNQAVFGFRTAGPIGHFHQYPVAGSTNPKQREDYAALAEKGKADEFALTSLKTYIDYNKSYPNADGDLSNAKPLFYENASINLFYLYNHVYHFFNNWIDYDHSGAAPVAEASLAIRILNPAPSTIAETTVSEGFVINRIDHDSPEGTPPANIHSVNGDIALLDNMLANGNTCSDAESVTPIDLSSQKVMHLKPLKLYTAQFVANYNPRINNLITGDGFEAVVHSYVFQTSRYRNFAEQVESYALARGEGNIVTKAAVFTIDCTADTDNNVAQRVLRDQLLPSDEILREQYADRFDRLINGVFALDTKTLQVPVATEFNLIKRNGKVLGILVRNPEPFNNPRIPQANPEISSSEAMETMLVNRHTGNGNWALSEEYYVIHSKDRSQIFITGRDFNFDLSITDDLKFTFLYKAYDGLSYTDGADPVTVILNFNNYLL